jgi:acetyltransferase-like isoleucine patch superfamily enzyme
MGKALGEIGVGGALRYALGQLQYMLLKPLLVPPQLRALLLRLFGSSIGRGSIIHPVSFTNLYRTGFKGLSIGRECFIADECFFDLAEAVEIGDQVSVGERTIFVTHLNVGYRDHPLQERFPSRAAAIRVGRGAFIGVGAVILPGVTIGERAFVAAGAVVSEDVPEESLVGGVPAKELPHSRT